MDLFQLCEGAGWHPPKALCKAKKACFPGRSCSKAQAGKPAFQGVAVITPVSMSPRKRVMLWGWSG